MFFSQGPKSSCPCWRSLLSFAPQKQSKTRNKLTNGIGSCTLCSKRDTWPDMAHRIALPKAAHILSLGDSHLWWVGIPGSRSSWQRYWEVFNVTTTTRCFRTSSFWGIWKVECAPEIKQYWCTTGWTVFTQRFRKYTLQEKTTLPVRRFTIADY